MPYKDPEALKAYRKARYAATRDVHIDEVKAYYAANRDRISARRAAITAKDGSWDKRNPERSRTQHRLWREANPEKWRMMNLTGRMSLRARRAGVEMEPVRYEDIVARDGMVCGICKGDVADGDLSLDHIIPIRLGGPHKASNLQVAHLVCNIKKDGGRPKKLAHP